MYEKNKICVFILTYNEEVHLERAIKSIEGIADEIVVIDSFSNDRTESIAHENNAFFIKNKWPGSHSKQLNWALKNHITDAYWSMRLDADEVISNSLAKEINNLKNKKPVCDGFYLKRGHIFMDKKIRYGGSFPVSILRIWKTGKGICEDKYMDEHIKLPKNSKTLSLKHYFWDHNIKGINEWVHKHNNYAEMECLEQLMRKYKYKPQSRIKEDIVDIKFLKKFYEFLPISIRAFTYFIYRYIFRLGFLDGYRGFLWHFLQAFWYRMLVDIKVLEIENSQKKTNKPMKSVIEEKFNISLSKF